MSGSDPARRAGIVEYEPADLTVVADARLRLSELAAVVGEHSQRLALDPPGDPTLAECLLEDLSGPLRHRFGTMRDLVLGAVVVLGDGLRAHSGGKVVKNVAGFDIAKLFCGSRGRLGTVERLSLRLHPKPASARSLIIAAERWAQLRDSQLDPSAVDLVSGDLHVLFEGSRRAVDAQARELGGEERDRWSEIRALQAGLPGRARWDGGEAPLIRPGPAVAYTQTPAASGPSALVERVVEAMWTAS